MKKLSIRLIAAAPALGTCIAMTGCGDDKTTDDVNEDDIEAAIDNMTDDELENFIEQGALSLDN